MKRKIRLWLWPVLAAGVLIFTGCNKTDGNLIGIDPWVNYGSLKDLDGNTYRTIAIGSQTWMVGNLSTTQFNDGSPIPVITDAAAWGSLLTPGCCWQNNDPPRKVTYGVLYNWFAVSTGKLCPSGWHVPSDEEWTELTTYLGGENTAGGTLKETGLRHWKSPNTGATNGYYFWAYPGGDRQEGPEAAFENLLEKGLWWTTSYGTDMAVSRIIFYDNISVQKTYSSKQMGLSVRCLKN